MLNGIWPTEQLCVYHQMTYVFYGNYYNALISYPKQVLPVSGVTLVWSDLQSALKMKTAKYNYYYYYHVKTQGVYLARQKEGELHVFISLKICKCKVKSIGVKSSQRQCILNGHIWQKAGKGPGITNTINRATKLSAKCISAVKQESARKRVEGHRK